VKLKRMSIKRLNKLEIGVKGAHFYL